MRGKTKNVHDHSGTVGRRKVYYTTHCEIHGTKGKGSVEKEVRVSEVTGRKAKYSGCPLCKRGM